MALRIEPMFTIIISLTRQQQVGRQNKKTINCVLSALHGGATRFRQNVAAMDRNSIAVAVISR